MIVSESHLMRLAESWGWIQWANHRWGFWNNLPVSESARVNCNQLRNMNADVPSNGRLSTHIGFKYIAPHIWCYLECFGNWLETSPIFELNIFQFLQPGQWRQQACRKCGVNAWVQGNCGCLPLVASGPAILLCQCNLFCSSNTSKE